MDPLDHHRIDRVYTRYRKREMTVDQRLVVDLINRFFDEHAKDPTEYDSLRLTLNAGNDMAGLSRVIASLLNPDGIIIFGGPNHLQKLIDDLFEIGLYNGDIQFALTHKQTRNHDFFHDVDTVDLVLLLDFPRQPPDGNSDIGQVLRDMQPLLTESKRPPVIISFVATETLQ